MQQQQVIAPGVEELQAYSLGKGSPQRLTEIEAYLAEGPDCTTILAAAPEDALVRHLRGARELANGHPSPPRIPGYEVLAELGRGGMGVVYHARHLALNRPVALKMILAGGHAGPSELARFRQEAETVARLQHPNIVQVYEVGEHAGLPFIALEYVEGGNLSQKAAGAPQPAAAAAGLVELLARAIDYAHQQGIIHRDLKPANVLLTAAGAPKLSDFGLARRTSEATGMTATGAVIGTPGYLAPEQAYAKWTAFGPPTDVYGLGAILYYLLTGRPPFQAATAAAMVLHTIVDEPVRPTQLQSGVPRDLETICLKCLQKEPARRYSSAGALAEDLRRFQAGEPITARPVGRVERGWRWCRRNPVVAGLSAAAVVLLVAVSAVSLVYAVERGSAARSLQAEKDQTDRVLGELRIEKDRAQAALKQSRSDEALLTADRAIRICEAGEDGQLPDVSRGLLWLARAVELAPEDDEQLQHLLRVNWAAWQARLCPLLGTLSLPPLARSTVAVSPDGQRSPTLDVRNIFPREERVAWSPDGQRVLAAGEQGLEIWEVRGWRKVQTLPISGKPVAVAWSRNGRWVAGSAEADGLVRIFNLDDGSCRTVKEPAPLIHELAFSPDSTLLIAACHDGKVRFWDPATAEARGDPVPVTAETRGDPVRVMDEQVTWVAFDRDGGRFLTTTHRGLQQWDTARRKAIGQLIAAPSPRTRFFCGRYSPDGERISFCVTDDSPGGFTGVYVLAAQPSPGQPRQKKMLRTLARCAEISPDGKHLLVGLDNCRGGVYDLDRTGDIANEDALFTITGHPRRLTACSFAPHEGRTVLTVSNDGEVRVSALPNYPPLPPLSLPLKGPALPQQAEYFTAPGIRCLAVGPDGQWLFAAGWDRDGLLLGAADGAVRGVLKGHKEVITAAVFTPDGKRLLTGSADGTVRPWDVATGNPLPGTWLYTDQQDVPIAVVHLALSPDGSQILVGVKNGGHVLPLERLAAGGRSDNSGRLWNGGRGGTFLPDGNSALIGQPFAADFLDVARGKRTDRELSQTSSVSAVAVDAAGQWAATGAWGVGQVWDLRTGNPIGPPLLHKDDRFMGMAFSPDGRLLASLAFKKGVRFWDVATGRAVGPVLQHPGESNALVFQPDGSALLTSSTTPLVYRWPVPRPVTEDVGRLMLRTQVLTGMELDAEGVVRNLSPDAWRERRQRLEELAPGTVPYFAPQ